MDSGSLTCGCPHGSGGSGASKAGLVAQSPCRFCAATFKQPGLHLKHCGPVFRLSRNVASEAEVASAAEAEVNDVFPHGFGNPKQSRKAVEEDGPQSRCFRPQQKGGKGQWGQSAQLGLERLPRLEPLVPEKESASSEEIADLVRLLSKVVLKLEEENARLRSECWFILYLDIGASQAGEGYGSHVSACGSGSMYDQGASNTTSECGGRDGPSGSHRAWMAEGGRCGSRSTPDIHEVGPANFAPKWSPNRRRCKWRPNRRRCSTPKSWTCSIVSGGRSRKRFCCYVFTRRDGCRRLISLSYSPSS